MILVGLLVSYLPQHWRIISRRTSEGISPYFVLLGVTSATASFANIVMLPGSQEDISCCRVLNTFECLAGLLGMAQFAAQFFCFAFMYAFLPCLSSDSSPLYYYQAWAARVVAPSFSTDVAFSSSASFSSSSSSASTMPPFLRATLTTIFSHGGRQHSWWHGRACFTASLF